MEHNHNVEHRYVRLVVAEPSAIGLFGLALVTLVASSSKMGWTTGLGLVLPWVIFLGAVAQLIACFTDLKHNNVFGATAFAGYGLFWLGMAMGWMTTLGVFGEGMKGAVGNGNATAFAFVGYLIFTLIMTIAAFETNKVLLIIFILIDFLFLGLMFSQFGIAREFFHDLAAWSEILISAASFYGVAGNVLNRHFGFEFLPMGKPCGIFKK
ncbi:MAG: acetate uptake transporter [Fusobacteriaceae bacterium]